MSSLCKSFGVYVRSYLLLKSDLFKLSQTVEHRKHNPVFDHSPDVRFLANLALFRRILAICKVSVC